MLSCLSDVVYCYLWLFFIFSPADFDKQQVLMFSRIAHVLSNIEIDQKLLTTFMTCVSVIKRKS